MLARLVVYRELNLVCLVHIDIVVLVIPPVRPGHPSSSHHVVLHLDGNKRFGTSGKPAGGGMVNVFDGNHSDRKLTC